MTPHFKKEFIRFRPGSKEVRKFEVDLFELQRGKCLCCGREGHLYWSPVKNGVALWRHHQPFKSHAEWEDTVEKCLLLCSDCHTPKVHGGKVKVELINVSYGDYGKVCDVFWKITPITQETSKATRIREMRTGEKI